LEIPKKKKLPQKTIDCIIADLLDQSQLSDGKRRLAKGAVAQNAKKFKCSERTIQRIWKQANENRKKEGSSLIAKNSSVCV
jgi:hypothetical protein